MLRTSRTIHPGIQIGHGIVHLTAVTEDIVGPEYQFGLFLFTEFLTQFKVQTIIRLDGHCPCFVPIISIKIINDKITVDNFNFIGSLSDIFSPPFSFVIYDYRIS